MKKQIGKIQISLNESAKTNGTIELSKSSCITLIFGKQKYTYDNKPFICSFADPPNYHLFFDDKYFKIVPENEDATIIMNSLLTQTKGAEEIDDIDKKITSEYDYSFIKYQH